MASVEQSAWVSRVLGVTAAGPAASSPSLLAVWRDAKERVDGNIATLQDRMRKLSGVPQLAKLADGGLSGLTGKRSVGMMVALMEAEGGRPEKLHKATAAFRTFLASGVAATIDDNPFRIAVGLVGTLGGALDEIERRIG